MLNPSYTYNILSANIPRFLFFYVVILIRGDTIKVVQNNLTVKSIVSVTSPTLFWNVNAAALALCDQYTNAIFVAETIYKEFQMNISI